jgi:hypothetical protein
MRLRLTDTGAALLRGTGVTGRNALLARPWRIAVPRGNSGAVPVQAPWRGVNSRPPSATSTITSARMPQAAKPTISGPVVPLKLCPI